MIDLPVMGMQQLDGPALSPEAHAEAAEGLRSFLHDPRTRIRHDDGVGVPQVVGVIGTGPVDLRLATEVLSSPPGYDLPGGSGVVFNRAYLWFEDAARAATSEAERTEHRVGAARALNNLAYWFMARTEDPERLQNAFEALRVAENITDSLDAPKDLRGAILANLGGVLALAGHKRESRIYLRMAKPLGVAAA